ncbi:hypothetical protein RRG08_017768 [Elysia crispata]|uniref:Uncharacterized protein n=1 Tax=Elysia crispata TaxID=231223 RepID=A0AAE0YYR7_9GAST|nr:hypothetical protein RRG08_017767 [Elysia crispata]KAK3758712.1 hypothetical protein RRG08_017768 [Elysia crispata]
MCLECLIVPHGSNLALPPPRMIVCRYRVRDRMCLECLIVPHGSNLALPPPRMIGLSPSSLPLPRARQNVSRVSHCASRI